MRDLIRNLISAQLSALILGMFLAGSALGQLNRDVEITIKADSTMLRPGFQFEVALTITNRSDKSVELPSTIHLTLDDGTAGPGGPTMSNGCFWAPFSATKAYQTGVAGCQSDLENDRVRRQGPAVIIYPSRKTVTLKSEEQFKVPVDLSKVCWAHSISNTYPYEDLFTAAKPGKYSLFASLSFPNGTRKVDGVSTPIPISRTIESNKLIVTLDW